MGVRDFIRIASRYDTLMARAMLKACGVTREDALGTVNAPRAEYGGIAECFENRTRVRMDYGA